MYDIYINQEQEFISIYNELASDPHEMVREIVAAGIHETV